MLIDTKIVKRLNFPFCKSNAIYLLVDYMDRNEEIQTISQHIPVLIDFMEWQYAHDYRILTQDGLNEYISFLYEKNSFECADLRCCLVKSFCKYLSNEGFCGSVSFSERPHSDTKNAQEENSSTQDKSEEPKKRRGRPRKSESQPESGNQNVNNNDEEKSKKHRGRKPKSDESYQNESEQVNNNNNTQDNTADNSTGNTDPNNGQKKRRVRPPKGSAPKLKRVTNYYEFLGVTPDADLSEIKKAYRRLAMEMHPDLHKDDPYAEKRTIALNVIMSVLKDEIERMVYDVAMGFIEYDESMEHVTYKEIKWHTKRHYTVWM